MMRNINEEIAQQLKIEMNPAVYLAALLIDEGYADASRRGYIRFRSKSRKAKRTIDATAEQRQKDRESEG